MSKASKAPKTVLQKLLDVVEKVGTIVALMLPFTVATSVAWILIFLAWYYLGLPFGPG
jgi:p-aminobenzoyl-glutamate transporter AbgT